MKKSFIIISLIFFLVTNITALAADNDPVVMKIAGKDITRSEFEYYFNKNKDAKEHDGANSTVESYKDLFIDYKLKVQAALDAHLDTLSSFQKEFLEYRNQQLQPYLKDDEYLDSLAHAVYDDAKKQIGTSDLLYVAHILVVVPQKADDKIKEAKKAKIDSAYQALQAGEDFAEVAKKFSEDRASAKKGGDMNWFGPNQTIREFEDAAYALKPGSYCKPFSSTVGYHIILMKERKQLESFEEKKTEIMKLLNEQGVQDMAAEHKIKRMVAESNGKLTREDVIANVLKEAYEKDPNLHFLINEYHDGLLLYEETNREVWKKAADDTAGLEKYFKQNKSKYKWESPRFRGYVLFAHTKSLMNKAVNLLKKYNDDSGVTAFNKMFADSMVNVRQRYGIFKVGDNPYVDYCKFCKTAPKENKYFPYTQVIGKLLKKPELYTDVRAEVTSDYQDAKEKEWVQGLRKKYPAVVNKEALETVNKH